MRAVSIVGPKKSGKTTLGLKLTEVLTSLGYKVAVAKHSGCGFDRQDSDTGRYLKVCAGVIGLGPDESMISWPGERFLPDMLPLVDADVLIVEGGKSYGWLPRILMFDDLEDAKGLNPELALACHGKHGLPGAPKIDSVGELAKLVLDRGFVLPGLDCGSCKRENCRGLAMDIVAGKAEISDCKSLDSKMKITVNGKNVALNPFMNDLFAAVIQAMLGRLKGFAPGHVKIDMGKIDMGKTK